MDHPAIDFQIESSGPGELHPQALTDLAVFWLRWFDNM
jgi:hypothetical protein